MRSYIRIELFKSFKKVNYYTFIREKDSLDEEISETSKFFDKFEGKDKFEASLNNLVAWIIDIGDNRGAKSHFFRYEDRAGALPPNRRYLSGKDSGNLRLYCIPINEQIVILSNGGEKTANVVKDCPDLLPKFRFANSMAKQINDQELETEGKVILNTDEIILEF